MDKTSDSITSSYSSQNIVTFRMEYFNQKTDVFESHQRSKICLAINEALRMSRRKPGLRNVSKEFPLYSEDSLTEGDFATAFHGIDCIHEVHGCFAVSVYQKELYKHLSNCIHTPKIHGLETQAVEMILPRCKAQKMKSAFRTSCNFSLDFELLRWVFSQ